MRAAHVQPTATTALSSAPGSTRGGARNSGTAACTCLSLQQPARSMPARTEQISESQGPRHVAGSIAAARRAQHKALAGESGFPMALPPPAMPAWAHRGAQSVGQLQEQDRGCWMLCVIPATTDASSVPSPCQPPEPSCGSLEPLETRPQGAWQSWTLPWKARHGPRDTNATQSHLPTPYGADSAFPPVQRSWQRAPSPRDSTGTQALPSPLLPPAQESPDPAPSGPARHTPALPPVSIPLAPCSPPPRSHAVTSLHAGLAPGVRRAQGEPGGSEPRPAAAGNLRSSGAGLQQVHLVLPRRSAPSPAPRSRSVGPTTSALPQCQSLQFPGQRWPN